MPELEIEVVIFDPGTHLHLFEVYLMLLLASFTGLPLLLVAEFPVVHDPADGRTRIRRHLYQIQPLLLSNLQGTLDGQNSELLALRVDDPDRTDPDLLVDTRSLVYGRRSRI